MILGQETAENKINVACDPLLELTGLEGRQTLDRNDRCGERYKGGYSGVMGVNSLVQSPK